MEQKNFYDILGVSENASADEIKKAYRRLVKEHHPDRHPGDAGAEARFKELGEAYDVLKDPEKRRKYDELRRYGAGQAPGSMSYEDFMSRFGGYQSEDGVKEEYTWGFGGGLEDIFSELFNTRRGGAGSQGPRSQGTRSQGARSQGARRPRSGGVRFDFGGGQHGGHPQASPSDEPVATADPFFKRKGDDAYVDIPVNLAQLMLGSRIRVRTPLGKKVNVRIAAGTQPEAVLRVRGMGYADQGRQGDLYIRVHLRLPAPLDEEQRQKLAELFREMGMKF